MEEETKMERLKQLQKESHELGLLEISTQIVNFFKNEYDLVAYVNKYKNFLDVYLSDVYQTNEVEDSKGKDAIATKLLKFYNKLDNENKAVAVWQTEYGYAIVFDTDEAAEEKMLTESLLYYYWYAEDETDENKSVFELKQRTLKENKMVDALEELEKGVSEIDNVATQRPRQEQRPEREVPRKEEVDVETDTDLDKVTDLDVLDKDTVEQQVDPSNIILDDTYIWFFTVATELGDELATGIDNLDEAIETVVDLNGDILVAIPYVDPDPENPDVDIVPSETPGPQFIYTREEL